MMANVYTRIAIFSSGQHHIPVFEEVHGSGPVVVREETNDDNDDGQPDLGPPAIWYLRFQTVEDALKHTGGSRVGLWGHQVTVHLDGQDISNDEAKDRANAVSG